MIWTCFIVFAVREVWAAERFPAGVSEFMYNVHHESTETRPSNNEKIIKEDPAPWSSLRLCCWDGPSWPMLPSPKLPTYPPFKPMAAFAKPFVPSVTVPTWAPLKTGLGQSLTFNLPQLTSIFPTYPPFRLLPPVKYPTWTQGLPTLAPWNTVSLNYSWPIPTYPPFKPLPLSPVFQLPYYPKLQYDAIPNDFPVNCPCTDPLSLTYLSRKPEVGTFSVNNIVPQSDAEEYNNWSQIQGANEDIPYVKINVTSIGVNDSDHISVNMEVPKSSSSTQIFDVGNTDTVNSVTIVVLNNCEKAKSDLQCAEKVAFNYIPSKSQDKQENSVDDGEITELLSALFQQVSLLDNENLYMLSNDQHSISTLNKDSLASVINALKPDGISGAASISPVDLFQMFGMPAVKESQLTKHTLQATPGKGDSEKPVFATNILNDKALEGRQQSGAVSPPKTEDSDGGSSTQAPNPASSGSDSAASQVTIPGSVGVENSRPNASSTVESSLPETTTNSSKTV